jgi:hypothetical protein
MAKLDCLFLVSCFFLLLLGNRRAQEGGDGVKEDSERAQGSAEGPSHLVQCRSYCFLSCLLFCRFLHFEPYPRVGVRFCAHASEQVSYSHLHMLASFSIEL